MLIVIEGPDGVGKTTQTRLLQDMIGQRASGFFTIETVRFPSKLNVFGLRARQLWEAKKPEDLRSDALVIQALMAADFYSQLGSWFCLENKPNALIADRWWYSALVYTLQEHCTTEWLCNLYAMVPKPDYFFRLTAPVEVCLERTAHREKDRALCEVEDYQKGVHARYAQFWNLARLHSQRSAEISTLGTPVETCAALWAKVKDSFV